MIDDDHKYMLKALALARRGVGSVEPNPAVGCVIVKGGEVIGAGWHKRFGGAHGEINALGQCRKKGIDTAGATMYVTLEPCCHEGKTGPCTKAIIEAGIGKVVAAVRDPSPHASGKGFAQLRESGIEVEVGICKEQAQLLNAGFLKFAATGRPWVICKWAQTIDGKVAWGDGAGQERWISNEVSRKEVHKLRRRVGAVLVGINTVLADDPLLTARPGRRLKPLRVVLDANLRIGAGCRLVRTAKKGPVLIVAGRQAVAKELARMEKLRKTGAEVVGVEVSGGLCDIDSVLGELGGRGVSQLLVEGGPEVIASFLQGGFVDEVWVYISPRILGGRGGASISEAVMRLTDVIDLRGVEIKQFAGDVRICGLLSEPGGYEQVEGNL